MRVGQPEGEGRAGEGQGQAAREAHAQDRQQARAAIDLDRFKHRGRPGPLLSIVADQAASTSAATLKLTILSGSVTLPFRAALPFLIASMNSMPDTVLPQTVY